LICAAVNVVGASGVTGAASGAFAGAVAESLNKFILAQAPRLVAIANKAAVLINVFISFSIPQSGLPPNLTDVAGLWLRAFSDALSRFWGERATLLWALDVIAGLGCERTGLHAVFV